MVFLDPRKRILKKLKGDHPQMRAYLSAEVESIKAPAKSYDYLSVDLEMTGLNPKKDKILSIGYVAVSDLSVVVDSMQHSYVFHQNLTLGQSATIHGIRSADLESGEPIEQLIDELLQAAAGKVLVFHNAQLDMGFLNAQIKKQYGFNLPVRYIDTMQVELRRLTRANKHHAAKLRLDDCRERYHLPRYKAHNAAIDALATAELWLAQLAHISRSEDLALKYFLWFFSFVAVKKQIIE